MEAIERGTVKSLRVVESPEKRFWTQPAWDGGTGQQAPAWPGTTSTTSGFWGPCR